MKYLLVIAFGCLLNSANAQVNDTTKTVRVEMVGPVGDPSKGELRGPTGCVLGTISMPTKEWIKERKRYRKWYKKTYGFYPYRK